MHLYELVGTLYYKEDRLRLLTVDRGHEYENLPGGSRSLKAQNLVEILAAERRLLDLFLRPKQDFLRQSLSDFFYELIVGHFRTKHTRSLLH